MTLGPLQMVVRTHDKNTYVLFCAFCRLLVRTQTARNDFPNPIYHLAALPQQNELQLLQCRFYQYMCACLSHVPTIHRFCHNNWMLNEFDKS
eukprot:5858277-Amphidinium_carterae.1